MMIRALVRKQLRELGAAFLRSSKTGKARSRASAVGYALLFAVLVVVLMLCFAGMALPLASVLLPAGLDWLYFASMGLTALLVSVLASAFTSYSGLFQSRDNELLLSLPIPPAVIFGVRVSTVYLACLIYLLMAWVPAVVCYGLLAARPLAGVLCSIPMALVLAGAACILAVLLGWAVALANDRARHKSLVTVVCSLVFFALYYAGFLRVQDILDDLLADAAQSGAALARAAWPLRLLGSYFHIAMNGAASAEKIFKLLAAEEPADGDRVPGENTTLKLEHVTFGYEKDRTILNDVSFIIPQGSFVSLVGESGCGKSTIAALLSGSRTGYTGSVTLGGVPVEQLQRAQRLRALTLVPHNAAIFKGTVESNLRMAKPDADETQLWAALEQVNLADFCRSQNGLQTALHEGGSNLSGGQRQRLAMARALLHDTPIYLFDEATSNVDAESENDIMQAIHSLAGKKTIILISHRLANVVHSDCIYAMSNGRVIEQGTHAELLAKQGAYSRLYLAQRQLETLEEEDA